MSAAAATPGTGRPAGPTRRDALWTIGTTAMGALLQLAQLMVAARYLDARSFGALAIVNIVAWVVLAFQDMGLSSFCVHIGEVPRSSHSTLFWISSGLGLVGSVLVAGMAYPLAAFYAMPELATLLPLLGLNFLLLGLGSQYQANLVRTFRSRLLAQCELAARLIGFCLTVALLVTHTAGVAAIVAGLIAFALCKLVFMAWVAEPDWHPRLQFDLKLAPRALRYGAYQAASQVVNQLRTQADQLILGRALGPEALGVYSLAKELISYPMRFLQPLLSRLTLPVLARHQGDREAMRGSYLRSMKRTAFACAAVYGALAVAAPWVVEIVYGGRFLAVAALLPWLALFGALRPLGLNAGMLAQATGRTANEFRWNMLGALVMVGASVLVAWQWPNVTAFAIAAGVVQLLLTLLAYPYFVRPLEPVGAGAYVRSWAAPFAGTAALAALAVWLPLPTLASLNWLPHQVWGRLMAALAQLLPLA